MTAAAPSAIDPRVAELIRTALGARRYEMWFDRAARFDTVEPGDLADLTQSADDQPAEPSPALRITVPSRYNADWIRKHFLAELQSVAHELLGASATLDIAVDADAFADAGDSTEEPAADSAVPNHRPAARPRAARVEADRQVFGDAPLRHRLDRFVVGPSNQLAHAAAARLVVADPVDPDIGDAGLAQGLFLHGGCGLGKTHLLQGLCLAAREARPDAKVVYTTGEQFTNAFIEAVKGNRLDAYRRRIRALDLLAVDDVHFIAGREKTQQEFLHTFDQIELGGARLAFASDHHPKLIRRFSEAIVSRFMRGLVVQIDRPDLETRRQLVRKLAQRRGMVLEPPAVELLAEQCLGSVRELEGALAKLHALATLGTGAAVSGGAMPSQPVGRGLVQRLLQNSDFAPLAGRGPLTPESVLDAACRKMGVTRSAVLGSSRASGVVLARAITVGLLRELTSMSFPEIAHALGRKNHSGVLTAHQRLTRQLDKAERVRCPGTPEPVELKSLLDQVKADVLADQAPRRSAAA